MWAFGQRMRKRREQIGMSQLDLARLTGMPQARLSEFEHGVRTEMTVSTALKTRAGAGRGYRLPSRYLGRGGGGCSCRGGAHGRARSWRAPARAPTPASRARSHGLAAARREPRRDQRERHRCGPPAAPARFPARRQATNPAARRALSRPRSAERSEGSLDSRSPPSRYTLFPPGRAGVFACLGAPGGQTGALAPPAASASRAGFAAGARGRGRRRVGGGVQAATGRRAQAAEGDAGA